MKILLLVLLVLLFAQIGNTAPNCGNSVTVQLGKAKPFHPSVISLECLALRAKYKCTPVGKTIKGIGSYYGKGDKFTGGKTLCEKPFKPMTDRVLALQDSLIPFKDFRNHMCGRRAVIVSYEPDTGRCTSTMAELSDTGNLGAKDVDGKSTTPDILKRDTAMVGGKRVSAPRVFDLSYAAAKALGYAEDGSGDDGKAYMEVQICEELAPNATTTTRKK